MSRLQQSLVIHAPVSAVWAVLSNHEGYVDWAGVDEMEVLSEDRALGARRRVTIGRMVMDQTIDAFEPEAEFAYAVGSFGPFARARTLWSLEADGDDTRVQITSDFALRLGLPGFLFAWRVRQGQTTALSGLKAHIEDGG